MKTPRKTCHFPSRDIGIDNDSEEATHLQDLIKSRDIKKSAFTNPATLNKTIEIVEWLHLVSVPCHIYVTCHQLKSYFKTSLRILDRQVEFKS
jgi:hypothetical protein